MFIRYFVCNINKPIFLFITKMVNAFQEKKKMVNVFQKKKKKKKMVNDYKQLAREQNEVKKCFAYKLRVP